jgi:hypothetical protein
VTQQDQDRYLAAAHAMQSGVAMKMNYDVTDTEPKHLRVGINAAFVGGSALARLLIDKGVITLDEYQAKLAEVMEEEAQSYTQEMADHFGGDTKVTLA